MKSILGYFTGSGKSTPTQESNTLSNNSNSGRIRVNNGGSSAQKTPQVPRSIQQALKKPGSNAGMYGSYGKSANLNAPSSGSRTSSQTKVLNGSKASAIPAVKLDSPAREVVHNLIENISAAAEELPKALKKSNTKCPTSDAEVRKFSIAPFVDVAIGTNNKRADKLAAAWCAKQRKTFGFLISNELYSEDRVKELAKALEDSIQEGGIPEIAYFIAFYAHSYSIKGEAPHPTANGSYLKFLKADTELPLSLKSAVNELVISPYQYLSGISSEWPQLLYILMAHVLGDPKKPLEVMRWIFSLYCTSYTNAACTLMIATHLSMVKALEKRHSIYAKDESLKKWVEEVEASIVQARRNSIIFPGEGQEEFKIFWSAQQEIERDLLDSARELCGKKVSSEFREIVDDQNILNLLSSEIRTAIYEKCRKITYPKFKEFADSYNNHVKKLLIDTKMTTQPGWSIIIPFVDLTHNILSNYQSSEEANGKA